MLDAIKGWMLDPQLVSASRRPEKESPLKNLGAAPCMKATGKVLRARKKEKSPNVHCRLRVAETRHRTSPLLNRADADLTGEFTVRGAPDIQVSMDSVPDTFCLLQKTVTQSIGEGDSQLAAHEANASLSA